MVHSWGRSLNGHLCPLKCLIRLPYHGALKIEELNRLRDNPSERAQETKQPSEDSRIVVEDKEGYHATLSGFPSQVRAGSNPSERVLYLYPYFEPRTGRRVWSLPPPELLTGLGSRSSRFRFEPEFGTGLRQH